MRRVAALPIYAAAVSLAGTAVACWMILASAAHLPSVNWLLVLSLAAAIVVWELLPVPLIRVGQQAGVTAVTNTFSVALVAVAPPGLAFLAVALSCLIDDIKHRVAWYKTLFNIAMYGLMVAAARAVFCLLSGDGFFSTPAIGAHHVLPLLGAGVAYSVVMELLHQPLIAMVSGERLRSTFVTAARENSFNHVVETSSAVLAVAATALLTPLAVVFLFPSVLAVWRSAKIASERIEAAWYDTVTGLPNLQKLNQLYATRREEVPLGQERVALLLVGLDRLKRLSNSLGDDAVELLVADAAGRLSTNVRSGDVVARRGDDFVVLAPLEDPDADKQLQALAVRLFACLNEPFYPRGVRVDVPVTIGAVVSETAEEDLSILIRRAAAALDSARAESPGTLRLHSAELDQNQPDQFSLLGDLRQALDSDSDQIEVHFQPKIRAVDGLVVGAEALVRWKHPERGFIRPDEFIPLAQDTGLIGPLTWRVLDLSLAQARRWREEGRDLNVAVNFAAPQLIDPATVTQVLGLLDEHGLDPKVLTVEVTEGTLLEDQNKATQVLSRLRRMGVKISVDDYGTGYSSLSYLQKFALDELKLDRSFIEHLALPTASSDRAIVASTIQLAHDLGLSVVAEGVEDLDCQEVLRDLGCDLIQGYLHSKPLPAGQLAEWLASKEVAAAPPLAPLPQQRVGTAGPTCRACGRPEAYHHLDCARHLLR